MMWSLINYSKTMHTTHLSEMTDDSSISLTWFMSFSCDSILSSILQYTIISNYTKSEINFIFKKGVGITMKSKQIST